MIFFGLTSSSCAHGVYFSASSLVSGSQDIYGKILKIGMETKQCTVCSRHMTNQEMIPFKKFVRRTILDTDIPLNLYS